LAICLFSAICLGYFLGVHSEGKHGGVGGGKHGGKHGGKKKPRQMAEKRQMAKAPPSGDAA
jgi:hypothetical protein